MAKLCMEIHLKAVTASVGVTPEGTLIFLTKNYDHIWESPPRGLVCNSHYALE